MLSTSISHKVHLLAPYFHRDQGFPGGQRDGAQSVSVLIFFNSCQADQVSFLLQNAMACSCWPLPCLKSLAVASFLFCFCTFILPIPFLFGSHTLILLKPSQTSCPGLACPLPQRCPQPCPCPHPLTNPVSLPGHQPTNKSAFFLALALPVSWFPPLN